MAIDNIHLYGLENNKCHLSLSMFHTPIMASGFVVSVKEASFMIYGMQKN